MEIERNLRQGYKRKKEKREDNEREKIRKD